MRPDSTGLPVILLYNLNRVWTKEEKGEILEMVDTLTTGLSNAGHAVTAVCIEDDALEQAMVGFDPQQHVVFNWCEELPGQPHSSSLVARKLEQMGFTITGADSRALLFSQDKPAVKEKLRASQVPIPDWQVCEPGMVPEWKRFPAIVKPAYEHCSLGITQEAVVHDPGELARRMEHMAREFQQPILVEDFIDGREFHVTVVGNGRLHVLPVAEMDFSAIAEDRGRLCTYDSKFSPESRDYQMIQLKLPAVFTPRQEQDLERAAIPAYKATGCRDYARLDIRLRDDTFYVLDVNPNADISPDTSVILSAEKAGYSFGQFASLLVNLAAHRHPVFKPHLLPTMQIAAPCIN
jgi:D-alanine-D-alanine ligase